MSRLSNSANDLRAFMGELDRIGELRAIKGADWNLEIGALAEIAAGEWPGYYADTTVGEVQVMAVSRIYHRNEPIMLGAAPLKPPASGDP